MHEFNISIQYPMFSVKTRQCQLYALSTQFTSVADILIVLIIFSTNNIDHTLWIKFCLID